MRHRVAGHKLGRNMAHRRALLRNLVTSLILEERIETTLAKAADKGVGGADRQAHQDGPEPCQQSQT